MTRIAMFLASLGLLVTAPAIANDTFMPLTLPVPLDPYDSSNRTLGELEYLGGVAIEPGEEEIGGISGLRWHDGKLYAVSDDGHWLVLTTDEVRSRLSDVSEISMGDLLDTQGKRLRRKDDADAEALTLTANGDWLVAFERDHRIWRYAAFDQPALVSEHGAAELLANAQSNSGLETLATTQDGWLACGEWAGGSTLNCLRQSAAGLASFELSPPELLAARGGVPTDADCASNGVCFVLFRSYSREQGNSVGIIGITPDGHSETLAEWDTELTIDNFEGLAVREVEGRTFLYLVSDNNFSDDQRTLLLKFEVSQRGATAPGVPEKVYETVDVILETRHGDITVAIETERAPITAANFLRYVDEDRFDGIVFYRSFKVNWGEQPNGFVQAGVQYDPARVLDPIAHEPTSQTGLLHTRGALSMARFEPGTATGDFSIMLQEQPSMDADPDAADPEKQAGFSVFGYVTGGWDAVHAIHAAPIDPEKGEGWMNGQLLADPVVIIEARRAE